MEAAVVSCPCVMRAVKYRANNTLFLVLHSKIIFYPFLPALREMTALNTEALCLRCYLTPAGLKLSWLLMWTCFVFVFSFLLISYLCPISIKNCGWLQAAGTPNISQKVFQKHLKHRPDKELSESVWEKGAKPARCFCKLSQPDWLMFNAQPLPDLLLLTAKE